MMPDQDDTTANVWRWRFLAAFLIILSALLHVSYLASDAALDLAPDEAHYWDWSRHLDWSYYSKGPLVALLIRGGCELAGGLSEDLTASQMLAVRLPAVVCGSLLLISLYVLTKQVFDNERLAAGVVACALTLPVIGVGSTLITIDSPYTCCWGWALVACYRAIYRGSFGAWLVTGLLVGVGILAKYTMVLFLPSVGLFLLTSRERRVQLIRPGFWIMTGVAALCCLPILLWNWQQGWPTLRHVEGLAGGHGALGIKWLGPLTYVATQCGLFLVYWFVAWVAALFVFRPWAKEGKRTAYLWWMSVPMFATFLAFSFKTGGGEPNWPVTAYISGLVLAVAWIAKQLASASDWQRRVSLASLLIVCGLGLALNGIMHRSVWVYPLLDKVVGQPTAQQPLPIRRFDPTCRLRGWRQALAEAVDKVRREQRLTDEEPVLACTSWALPGELGFYCEGHPSVYSLGLPLGDRHSQYDLWHPNPIDDPSAFAGRTFLIVGAYAADSLKAGFETMEEPRIVTHYEQGRPVAQWVITVAHGYKGFDKVAMGANKAF
jgi:hypothetical protein